MDFKLCAKSNIDVLCLQDRKNKGFRQFELYTNSQILNHDFQDIKKRIDNAGLSCLVVHAPQEIGIRPNVNDCGVASLNTQINEVSTKLTLKSIDLGEQVFNTEDRYVVVHPSSQTFLDPQYENIFLLDMPQRYQKIREAREQSIKNATHYLKQICDYASSKNIMVCLENMSSIDMGFNGKYASFCSFTYYNHFIELLKDVDSPNLMFTLDICHLLSHIRIMRMINETNSFVGCNLPEDIENYKELLKEKDHEILIIEKYLDQLKNKIGVIHLNNSIEFGFTKATHSTKFTSKDKEFLKRIFKKLSQINYNNPITLEINETDLNDAKELLETYNIINSL